MPANIEAAASGDRVKALEELRATLAFQLDNTESQVHAQLAAQYRATLAELDEIKNEGKSRGGVDDLKARRQAKGRGSTADSSSNA